MKNKIYLCTFAEINKKTQTQTNPASYRICKKQGLTKVSELNNPQAILLKLSGVTYDNTPKLKSTFKNRLYNQAKVVNSGGKYYRGLNRKCKRTKSQNDQLQVKGIQEIKKAK